MTISSHIFENYNYIFHKSEVQTVNLRCWRGLNSNWFKSYDTSEKRVKTQKTLHRLRCVFFLQNHKKKEKKIFVFCAITFDPINSDEPEPSWRIFSSARLGSWPFLLQLGCKKWSKNEPKIGQKWAKIQFSVEDLFLINFHNNLDYIMHLICTIHIMQL